MKHLLSHLKAFTAALVLCGASLPAAEVTVTAPDSPMLRFALGKLEAALQQRGDTLRRVSNPALDQTIDLSVTIHPVAAGGVGPEGFRLDRLRNGRMIAGGDERGAMYGVLDLAEQIRLGTPWNKIEERTVKAQFEFRVSRHQVQPSVGCLPHQPGHRTAPGHLQGPQILGGLSRHDEIGRAHV